MACPHFPSFWEKGKWPANSPDLNPIENLWAILADRLDELGQLSNIESLIKNFKIAWKSFDPEIPNNLVSSMP